MLKRMIAAGLALCLLLAIPVGAQEIEETAPVEVTISTQEEFLEFAENCRLDTYSQGIAVTLEADIDLTGTHFSSVPIFSGTFQGQGHTVSGLNLASEGSVVGLFRYLTETAVVRDLHVEGQLQPGGKRSQVGGIAGQNAGIIVNCTFSGSVSGSEAVGGLVGVNTVTGMIESCRAEGQVHGDHFVGGIAGENQGVIRSCINQAMINTTPQQNTVELSDITMETLTDTESVNTVTDIGGIAGISNGVIRSCENLADVGYRHMGYNIGGIVGTQSGYVVNCENRGQVQGRKEVGGIVGQLEPSSLIEYTEDTLQILRGQLNTMSGMVDQTAANAQTNADHIRSQISLLRDQTQSAQEAVDALFPDEDNMKLPDTDTILAARNALSDALTAMPGTLRSITAATKTSVKNLTQDIKNISGQIGAMEETLSSATETLGGSMTDISDQDTDEDFTAKVENCINRGFVLADINVGGIAGAVSVETDLDILEDLEWKGEESLNFDSQLRAVILRCENLGDVTGTKQNVGGISGWQSMGLVKYSTNSGLVDGESAEYVGGISGLSSGYLRNNYAKCRILGTAWTGGIAGSASVATDCISMVQIQAGTENLGAILGEAAPDNNREEMPISGNLYLKLFEDPGAIDGISYSGIAEPVERNVFLAMENLPDLFKSITVRFLFEDGTRKDVSLRPGESLAMDRIPQLPEKEGFTASWAGLEDTDLTGLVFDMTFEAVYTPKDAVIESQQTGADGRSVLLAQGSFPEEAMVSAEEAEITAELPEGENLLDSRMIHLTHPADSLRLQLPEEANADRVNLYLLDAQGSWQKVEFRQMGSYLVFEPAGLEMQMALTETAPDYSLIFLALAAGALLTATVFLRKKKAKK